MATTKTNKAEPAAAATSLSANLKDTSDTATPTDTNITDTTKNNNTANTKAPVTFGPEPPSATPAPLDVQFTINSDGKGGSVTTSINTAGMTSSNISSAAEAAAKMSSLSKQLSMALPSFAAKTNAMMEEFLESQNLKRSITSNNTDTSDQGCLHCQQRVKGQPRIERLEENDEEHEKKQKAKKGSQDEDEDDEDEEEDENIQVRCDECQSYICNGCHWCHEFQANHEIRVCDRCDAFYCKQCDEMDQCDDCGEVVCGSCSTLLSCKFCGGGLCEECATACGRRDAKFAVDCDTCRLSYCLVCLASGSKDPCVRCGHRPSKRMEQLVHLRLKSIYKAFKSSSGNNPNSKNNDMKSNTMSNAAMASAAAANAQQQQQEFNQNKGSSSHHHHHDSLHGTRRKKPTTLQDMVGDDDDDEDLAAGGDGNDSDMMMMGNVLPAKFCHDLEQNYIAEQKKADEAAEALLAELEEEEEANAKKKSKKKKKKERKQAQKSEDEKKIVVPESKDHDDGKESQKGDDGDDVENDSSGAESPVGDDANQDEEDLGVQMDPVEKELMECVENGHVDGIEDILFRLKGVPGRAILRKNAKKALKRLLAEQEQPSDTEAEFETVPENRSSSRHSPSTSPAKGGKPSGTNRSSSAAASANKNETFVPIASTLVGWVIGKGGQRIRDMMEASGAKIWVDQEKVKGQPTRNVFISGDRKCVEQGVMLVKEVIANAPPPPGSTAAAAATVPQAAERSSSTGVAALDTAQKSAPQSWGGNASDKPLTMADRVKESTKTDAAPTILRASTPGNDTSGSGLITEVVSCETRFVPLLIGKRGWTIKNIQDESGARVDIDQTVTPRQIKISGSRPSVDRAVAMVRDVLSYPHAQLQRGAEGMEFIAAGDDAPAIIVEETVKAGNQPPSPTKEKLLAASARLEKEAGRTPSESPPPIVGDAKSAISASSSLSSTPEPSMASSAKGALASQQLQAQLNNGPLIPPAPQQFGGGAPNNLSNPAQSAYFQPGNATKNAAPGSVGLGATSGSSGSPLYPG
ncbi:MAG: hypothetical protein SGILL_006269, partial [Bacillariaceae sp.]